MKKDFFSYEQQDEFVANIFDHKQNGYFLDIACGHPILGNNTYTLEKNYGWTGICFDIYDVEHHNCHVDRNWFIERYAWKHVRNSKFAKMDVTTPEFTQFLKNNVPEDLVVDYISLDVDAAGTNLALETLHRVLDSGIKFKAMTFEHEVYLQGDALQRPSRELLENLGFVRLFEDVRLWCGEVIDDTDKFSEDWWIHPDYFDPSLLEIKKSKTYFFECIRALKKFKNLDYVGHHHCCQAYPEEVDYFADQGAHGRGSHAILTPGWKGAPAEE